MPSRPRKSRAAHEERRAPTSELDDERPGRARSFWSGTISFGLVTIPVDLYAATKTTRTSLRMLGPSGTPVVRRYFDSAGKPVDAEQLERGYELEDASYVVVSDDELERLAPEQSRDILLTRFVERDAIAPLFFERAYILAPSGDSSVAYRLLASVLERTRRAGIASFVMRGKQYPVAILAEGGLLRAETLRFAEELRTPESLGLPAPSQPSASKLRALTSAVQHVARGAPSTGELADTYWQRLEKLVKTKQKRGEDVLHVEPEPAAQANMAEVIDLVSILRKSLGQADPAHAPAAKRAQKTKSAPKARAKRAEKPRAKRGKKRAAS